MIEDYITFNFFDTNNAGVTINPGTVRKFEYGVHYLSDISLF